MWLSVLGKLSSWLPCVWHVHFAMCLPKAEQWQDAGKTTTVILGKLHLAGFRHYSVCLRKWTFSLKTQARLQKCLGTHFHLQQRLGSVLWTGKVLWHVIHELSFVIMLWGPVFWTSEETGHQEVSSQAGMAGKKSNEFTEQSVIQ